MFGLGVFVLHESDTVFIAQLSKFLYIALV